MVAKDIEIFLKKKETNSISVVVNDMEIFQKMKNKDYFRTQKLIKTS